MTPGSLVQADEVSLHWVSILISPRFASLCDACRDPSVHQEVSPTAHCPGSRHFISSVHSTCAVPKIMAHHSRDKHIEGHSYLYHSKNRNLFFLLKNPNIQCFLSFPSILTWSLGQSSAFREGCFPEEGGYLLSLKENTNVIWNLLMIKYEMRWLFGWITNVGELLIFTQRPPKMTMLRVLQMRINELFSSFFFLILSYFF